MAKFFRTPARRPSRVLAGILLGVMLGAVSTTTLIQAFGVSPLTLEGAFIAGVVIAWMLVVCALAVLAELAERKSDDGSGDTQ